MLTAAVKKAATLTLFRVKLCVGSNASAEIDQGFIWPWLATSMHQTELPCLPRPRPLPESAGILKEADMLMCMLLLCR